MKTKISFGAMKGSFLALALVACSFIVSAQTYNKGLPRWVVYDNSSKRVIGLDMAGSHPVLVQSSLSMGDIGAELVNAVTDNLSYISFYIFANRAKNTLQIYNGYTNILENTIYGLDPTVSSVKESAIVRKPFTRNKYYLILRTGESWGNVFYYELDRNNLSTPQNPPAVKLGGNIYPYEFQYGEGMAISQMNSCGKRWIFLVERKLKSDNKYHFNLVRLEMGPKGINNDQRTIVAGDLFSVPSAYSTFSLAAGDIEIAPLNNRLAISFMDFSTNNLNDIVVFDYDNNSGTVSNKVNYNIAGDFVGGIEFSPSGNYIYFVRRSDGSITPKPGRVNLISNAIQLIDYELDDAVSHLGLGYNGKIYINNRNSLNAAVSALWEIGDPDAANIGDIQFDPRISINDLNGQTLAAGLPDQIDGEEYWRFAPPGFEAEKIISAPTIWPASSSYNGKTFGGDITIWPGGSLTLQSGVMLKFLEGVSVIVQADGINPGGKLTLNSATLTGSACNVMWEGVQVWGDNDPNSPNRDKMYVQGALFMNKTGTNRPTIAHAKEAVRLWKPGDYFKSGGYIRATNALFRNNRRCIEFISHPTSGDFVILDNNIFETQDGTTLRPPYAGQLTGDFITDWDVDIPHFFGNTFKNGSRGIFSIDAAYDAEGNTFTNITGTGIYAQHSILDFRPATNHQFEDNVFNNAANWIRIDGGFGDFIRGNRGTGRGNAASGTGILLFNCQQFTIKDDNEINSIQNGIGLAFSGGLTTRSYVWKNKISDMQNGLTTVGDNRQVDFKCNEYSAYGTNGWLIKNLVIILPGGGTITIPAKFDNQEVCKTIPPPPNLKPAAEQFFVTGTVPDITSQATFTYFHHPDATTIDNYTSATVTVITCDPGKDLQTYCNGFNAPPHNALVQVIIGPPGDTDAFLSIEDPSERAEVMTEILRFFAEHNDKAGAIAFLMALNTVDAKKLLIPVLIEEREFAQARTLLNDIPQDTQEDMDFVRFHIVMCELGENGKSIREISGAQHQVLTGVANDWTKCSAHAQAVLHFAFGEEFPNPIDMALGQSGGRMAGNMDVVTNELKEPYLGNNIPNPFGNSSVIKYGVPNTSNRAVINVFDLTGRMIKTYNLEKGENKLEINANVLANGMYIYTMLVDGKVIGNKKMIVLK